MTLEGKGGGIITYSKAIRHVNVQEAKIRDEKDIIQKYTKVKKIANKGRKRVQQKI